MASWYWAQNDEQCGPCSSRELKKLVEAGTVTPDTLVWKDGLPDWVPASKVRGLIPNLADPAITQENIPSDDVEEQPAAVAAKDIPGLPQPNSTQQPAKRILKTLAAETSLAATDTARHFGGLVRSARKKYEQRGLEERVRQAKINLGQRLYEAGLGNEKLRADIENISERIQSVRAGSGSTKTLDVEHDGLRIRLAESVQDGPTPPVGAEDAFNSFQTAKQALEQHQNALQAGGPRLLPQDGREMLRVGAGYLVIVLGLYLTWSFLVGGFGSGQVVADINDSENVEKAIGFVVCGVKGTKSDGEQFEEPHSTGTAFAISPEGHLITNRHVVEATWNLSRAKLKLEKIRKELLLDLVPTVWVFFGEEKYEAEILSVSDDFDLGILKIDRPNKPYFALSISGDPSRGSQVFASGFPGSSRVAVSDEELALEKFKRSKSGFQNVRDYFKKRDFDFVMTSGIISRVSEEEGGRKWIQHNADINPGNSGGPLCSEDGTVLGVNTLTVTNASGTFYSLLSNQLKEEIEQQVPGIVWR